jgi:hypothetical protein
VGNNPVPACLEPCPNPRIKEYLLPNQLLVITEKVTFFQIADGVIIQGWIRGEDLEDLGYGLYKAMSQYGALLIDKDGKQNGEFLSPDTKFNPVKQITFGLVDDQDLWVDMTNLLLAYPDLNKKK